ncbi:MAG: C39 family peptidase [Acidobacteriaceae bacterium]|nr:C39 family peptidase [Acidobacteriaceae bacterium]
MSTWLRTPAVSAIFASFVMAVSPFAMEAQNQPPQAYFAVYGNIANGNQFDPGFPYNFTTATGGGSTSRPVPSGGPWGTLSVSASIQSSSASVTLQGSMNAVNASYVCNEYYGCGWSPYANTEYSGILVYVLGPPGTHYHIVQNDSGSLSDTVTESTACQNGYQYAEASSSWAGVNGIVSATTENGTGGFCGIPPPKSGSAGVSQPYVADGYSTAPTITYDGQTYSSAYDPQTVLSLSIGVDQDPDFSAYSGGAVTVSINVTSPGQQPPVAVIAPASGTAGSPVTLDGSGSYAQGGNSLVQFRWDIQNINGGTDTYIGSSSSLETKQYTWYKPGTYNVALTVMDSLGQTGTATVTVLIQSPCAGSTDIPPLPVTDWKQGNWAAGVNVPWAGKPYDHDYSGCESGTVVSNPTFLTMSSKGCALTAIAEVLQYYGAALDPGKLDDTLSAQFTPSGGTWMIGDSFEPGFGACGNIEWASAIAAGVRYGAPLFSYQEVAFDPDVVDSELCQGRPVIAQVSSVSTVLGLPPPYNFPDHYVVITGKQSGDYIINDPGRGSSSNSTLGGSNYVVLTLRLLDPPVFTSSPNSTSPVSAKAVRRSNSPVEGTGSLQISAVQGVDLQLADPLARTTGLLLGNTVQNIPQSSYYTDGIDQHISPTQALAPDYLQNVLYILNPMNGAYTLNISSLNGGSGTIYITRTNDGALKTPQLIQYSLNAGQSATYTFNYVYLPADLNADGIVNCQDLAIVMAAFGSQPGTPGWNPVADPNNDGVVDLQDLQFVEQAIPAGTACQIQGSLGQTSLGADGTAWGLTNSGAIYFFNPQTQSWQQEPGALSQIAVGSANAVWGTNANEQIYRWDINTQSWDYIPGSLSQIAVGSDGDVWGINYIGEIYHFNSQSQAWQQIAGNLKQIAVGFDGAVWGVNGASSVYRFNPGARLFEQVSGTMTHVAVGGDGDVWGLNNTSAYHFDRLTQNWDQTAGSFSQIAVGAGNNVWGLDGSGQLYQYSAQNSTWATVGTTPLAQISAGANGSVWAVDSSNDIYQVIGPPQTSNVFHQASGTLAQIAVGADGNVWGVNSGGQVYILNALTQGWTSVPGELKQISAGFAGNVWGLNADGHIYSFDSVSQNWTNVPGNLQQLAIGANGDVWGINRSQQIYRLDVRTKEWTQLPGSLRQISVGADGAVWGVNYGNAIYKFDALTQRWQQTPGALMQISVGSASNVWGINSEGGAYRFDSQNQSWDYVPGVFLTQIAVGFDGAVWGIDTANLVWTFDAPSQSWAQVPGSLTQISVGADAAVWGIDSSGSVYFYR